MIESSRETWRKGVPTLVLTNGSTPRRIHSPFELEVWYEAPDWPEIGWNNPSENRYTGQARLRSTQLISPLTSAVHQVRYANQTLDFDWLLSGDDDTIFLMDNVIDLVRDLDPDDEYYITDSLIFNESVFCTVVEEASERGPGGCVVSPPSTRCTRAVLEAPDVCRHDKVKVAEPGRFEEPPGAIWCVCITHNIHVLA